MSTQFVRAPHIEGSNRPFASSSSPNAALLIDFDNVTMGMRSDLSKELKSLLNSDVIKGKVTVQRAYADWRRYPQYIVPLSEASVDLIFAPAYGSSKKNATDIRMAIDGMELVFTRPEIGTYILLTGDSDFSSLVLKLKEYGKYVIGVGIQESSSDILVQNCDEYYSYTSISGLRKTTEPGAHAPVDPWMLVEKAVDQMVKRSDVMRSDRLKQVMLEIDSTFDEKSFGFSKFSRFLSEAVSKGVLQLQKMENGQYEILPRGGPRKGGEAGERPESRRGSGGRSRDRSRDEGREREEAAPRGRSEPAQPRSEPAPPPPSGAVRDGGREALEPGYALLLKSLAELLDDQGSDSVRDSDVKRRMLALDSTFDESELGFSKFSLFLRQADDHGVIALRKGEEGNYHVSPGTGAPAPAAEESTPARTAATPSRPAEPAATPSVSPEREQATVEFEVEGGEVRRLRPRLASRRRGGSTEPPELLEGQAMGAVSPPVKESQIAPAADGEVIDPFRLRLPTERESTVLYLTNSYRGVGQKTAETVVDAFGAELFRILQSDPKQVAALLPPARAEKLLEGWSADFRRRSDRLPEGNTTANSGSPVPGEVPDTGAAEEAGGRPRSRRTRGGGRPAR